jgi:hypothetical protein
MQKIAILPCGRDTENILQRSLIILSCRERFNLALLGFVDSLQEQPLTIFIEASVKLMNFGSTSPS